MAATGGSSRREQLHQHTIGVPRPANDILRALSMSRGVSRQTIIEPVVEAFALAHGPVAVEGLEALITELDGRFDEYNEGQPFPQAALTQKIDDLHASQAEVFPLLPLNPNDPRIKTGIRISGFAETIFKTVAVIEGHTSVSGQIEPLVNGYAHSLAPVASAEIMDYADSLQPPDTIFFT